MKAKLSLLVVAIASICTIWAARAQQSGTADVERYIRESERQWAESVANGDASVVERILADDFLGVDPDGSFYEKAKMVADTREAPKEFISNRLNDVKVRFFGDTAVAQGNESWVRRTVTPLTGRFVWTDTWIRRNDKWQIVASEDLIIPELAQKPRN
jgi:ketosteroid isomerase-like protein